MARPGALLLLLAVAASQVDVSVSSVTLQDEGMGLYRFNTCAIAFYGRRYESLRVSVQNLTAKLCFNDTSDPAEACLVVENPHAEGRVEALVVTTPTAPGSDLHSALPNINSTSNCSVTFGLGSLELIFYNFDSQSALEITNATANSTMRAMVGNFTAGSWTFNASKNYVELSGCRLSDSVLAPKERASIPASCSTAACSAAAVLSIKSNCEAGEFCEGNGVCFQPNFVCTVTGSTVIDFFGRITSVPNRCSYRLSRATGGSNFSIAAGFQERRRRDVPFLDSLSLMLGSKQTFNLLQGGRVLNNGQTLSLNGTARLVNGLELSKDGTGITAKIPDFNVTVYFDGYTAHVSGPKEPLRSLCGNPTNSSWTPTLGQVKLSSNPNCQIEYNDTADSAVNCSVAAQLCNLMHQAPFTSCHARADPTPYVTACKRTLCKYPTVDGLDCQFFKAYAKACSIRGVPVWAWRSAVGCSAAPQTFCQNKYCSEHEFCGEIHDGHRCFCRAIFASKYRDNDTLGEPTVCSLNSASLSLANCLLEDRSIDYSNLHLNDKNCTGDMDNLTHMVTFSFDETDRCGTEVMMNNSQVIYKNTIMSRNASTDVITRHDEVMIDFSCYYPKPELRTVAFRIKDSSVIQKIVSGIWNYTLKMNAYTDPGLTDLVIPTTEIRLNQKVWVELTTQGLDQDVVNVVTDSCWATNLPASNGTLRYNLIINRCPNPADQTVSVQGNGLGTSNSFSFNMFEFSGKTNEVYLHCKLELCLKNGNSCATNCSGGGKRKRRSFRSKYADENPALITMAWTN